MRRFLQLLAAMSRWERGILSLLLVLFLTSFFGLLHLFYLRNTVVVPGSGGTYIEGSVGELLPLNPWFIVQNDVNHDIVSLVFSGLLRYNPQTKAIESDLATLETSKDARVYTVKLKEHLFWQDSTPTEPHPITADDVLFTFKTVQNSAFPNPLLQQNFRGVAVAKVDDRTVKFTLDEPYSFFPSNLTLGLLPEKSFKGIPIGKLDQAVDFGYDPVGAGPYRVRSIVRTDLSTEVTLERFPRSLEPTYRLDRVVFRIFSDYSSMLSDLANLHGVRLVPRNTEGQPLISKRFTDLRYTLPQYVALFFNLDRLALQDQKLRQGLQQGTNKQVIADLIHEPDIVDTPLLELDSSDWHYKFDLNAAQGALLASKWNLPERVRLQRVLEKQDANAQGLVQPPPAVLLAPGTTLTLSGSYVAELRTASINGVVIRPSPSGSGSWMAELPTLSGTGALKAGDNLVKVTSGKNHVIDSFYVYGAKTASELARAMEEWKLAALFAQSKNGPTASGSRIAITDLIIDNGMLRRRVAGDLPSVRINEKGEPLKLTLLTSSSPDSYKAVALEVQREWLQLGVQVVVETATNRKQFQDRLLRRDYDVVLFGESLLDNLDSYPYWHSSGIQKLTGQDKDLRQDAYNLSQYVSFKADNLLETIRRTTDDKERQTALKGLRDILRNDAPAIFLYSPTYVFAHRATIFGIELGALSLHSDRFLTLYKWYTKEDRVFKPGVGWLSFFGWLPTLRSYSP